MVEVFKEIWINEWQILIGSYLGLPLTSYVYFTIWLYGYMVWGLVESNWKEICHYFKIV